VSDSPRKVALVTGAARGIGAATALRLARDGYAVGVLDLDESACAATVSAIASDGGEGLALGADVGDSGQVTAAVQRLAAELGGPTVLVNNAGITRDNLLFKLTEDDWDSVLRTHLRGAFLVSKAVQGFMTEAKWGRIVNLSSTSALGNRGQANYAAAKAGMQGFTKTLAIELGPFGVTVNAIAPGFIATDMTAATATRLGMSVEDFHRAASEQIPLRRVGEPDDIAGVVSFLVGDDASYVSGQVIYVAGGPKD
jgi:3-oxoacyl-[acyl-carrier protein] reductase